MDPAHAPIIAQAPVLPDWAGAAVDLADPRLGAKALGASDEFFAAKERMLSPAQPVFMPGRFDDNGKWMDGWETRRRRGPGHDWCVVRLARPGNVAGILVDTSFFTGNFPPAFSVDACCCDDADAADARWAPLVAPRPLAGDDRLFVRTRDAGLWSHVRLNIFPDGGVARFRVYGRPGPVVAPANGMVDLASALGGALAVAASDAHYGSPGNILLPGRGVNMGDGWETRRRREPGHDWCLIKLGAPGVVKRIEVDTAHFKGNYPDQVSLQGAYLPDAATACLAASSMFWPELLAPQKLAADHVHVFDTGLAQLGPLTHVRLNVHPDGGVSRLRLWGEPRAPRGETA